MAFYAPLYSALSVCLSMELVDLDRCQVDRKWTMAPRPCKTFWRPDPFYADLASPVGVDILAFCASQRGFKVFVHHSEALKFETRRSNWLWTLSSDPASNGPGSLSSLRVCQLLDKILKCPPHQLKLRPMAKPFKKGNQSTKIDHWTFIGQFLRKRPQKTQLYVEKSFSARVVSKSTLASDPSVY